MNYAQELVLYVHILLKKIILRLTNNYADPKLINC